jgi:cyanosortase A-associated protein
MTRDSDPLKPPLTKLELGRLVWVAGLSIACVAILGHTLFRTDKRQLLLGQRPYQFPAQLPTQSLPQWQSLQGQALSIKDPKQIQAIAAHQYQFQRQGRVLQAQVWYLRYIEGNVSRYVNLYTPITSTLDLQPTFQPQIGHASFVVVDRRAYLNSCINPQGPSTITESQFAHNRYTHDLNLGRVLMWGLGQQDLLDRRCLFTSLSISLDPPSSASASALPPPLTEAQAKQILQDFWRPWHQLWQSQFPKS